MWKSAIVIAQLATVVVLSLTIMDYQRMAMRRARERVIANHLTGQVTPLVVSRLRGLEASEIRVAHMVHDDDQAVSRALRLRLARCGFRTQSDDHTARRWAGIFGPSETHPNCQPGSQAEPDVWVQGIVEELTVTPVTSARLRLRLRAMVAGEAHPRFDQVFEAIPEPTQLALEFADAIRWVVPEAVPLIGGTTLVLEQRLMTMATLAIGLLGFLIRQSGSRGLFALAAVGYSAAVFWVFSTAGVEGSLWQLLQWNLLLAGVGFLAGADPLDEDSTAAPLRRRAAAA